MKLFFPKNKKRGMGVVEILVGAAIISVGLLGLVGSYYYYLKIMIQNTPNIQAAYLLEESMEVARLLRDQSWNSNIATLTVTPATKYRLVFNATTSKWSTNTTVVLIDSKFDRTITAGAVYRNASHNIVPSGTAGATLDSDTKLITASVAWREGNATTTASISGYITNIFEN